MIDYTKYVDHIFCLNYAGHKDRQEILNKELDRVDILNSPIYTNFYNIDTPLFQVLHKNLYKNPQDIRIQANNTGFHVTYGYYYIMKMSLQLGYEYIMIFENDIRFLNDKEKIEQVLNYYNDIKNKYDVFCFNLEQLNENGYVKNKTDFYNNICCNNEFDESSQNATMTIFSKIAMTKITNILEREYIMIDNYDMWNNYYDIKICALYPWICIQNRYVSLYLDKELDIRSHYNMNFDEASVLINNTINTFLPVGYLENGLVQLILLPSRIESLRNCLQILEENFDINNFEEDYNMCMLCYKKESGENTGEEIGEMFDKIDISKLKYIPKERLSELEWFLKFF